MKPIRTFTVAPSLPPRLERQRALIYNLYWAWQHDAIELFRWDRELWEKAGHNPVLMLGRIEQETLEAAATDGGFLASLDRVADDFAAYMKSETTWFRQTHGKFEAPLIAYFSAEFGITDCLSIFAGGLGILSGDHLKSASDLGLPLVGVGLLYQQGYFRQYLNDGGWQQEVYEENDFHNLPLVPERGQDGSPIIIEIPFPNRQVKAQIWRAQVGRVALYLLDTNIALNSPHDQIITDQLYGGDTEMRIEQEMLLGIGGYRALDALGIRPSVYHLNEGHSAFLALERARHLMETTNLPFAVAREAASAGLVFTTHTPVPAGHDYFAPELMSRYFTEYAKSLGLSWRDFLALGRKDANDDREPFCMTVLALRMAQSSNGVSRLHGQVTQRMWQRLWPGVAEAEIPIGHITNGVHFQSWISQEMDELYDRYLGSRWHDEPANKELWDRVYRIAPEELWRTHQKRRERLVAFVRRRLRAQLEHRGAPLAEIESADEALNPDILTIGFARRFASYKRATLLLTDLERLGRILNNLERPVQIVFAGRAHPHDEAGKELIKQIATLCRQPQFRHRCVFLEDYDLAAARSMVQGCDVWLSTPRRPFEASGTSGMKAAANGALNISTLDGWWDEAWEFGGAEESGMWEVSSSHKTQSDFSRPSLPPAIGWAIGRGESYDDPQEQDRIEAGALYELLESDVIPTFYDRGADNLPRHWIARMKASIGHLCHFFNTHRMVREYTECFYLPAAARYQRLNNDNLSRALNLAEWKSRVEQQWPKIRVESVTTDSLDRLQVNYEINVRACVQLGSLTSSDVTVELYFGLINVRNEIVDGRAIPMKPIVEKESDGCLFEARLVSCHKSGLNGFTIRVLPHHADLVTPYLPGLITWANAD